MAKPALPKTFLPCNNPKLLRKSYCRWSTMNKYMPTDPSWTSRGPGLDSRNISWYKGGERTREREESLLYGREGVVLSRVARWTDSTRDTSYMSLNKRARGSMYRFELALCEVILTALESIRKSRSRPTVIDPACFTLLFVYIQIQRCMIQNHQFR